MAFIAWDYLLHKKFEGEEGVLKEEAAASYPIARNNSDSDLSPRKEALV